MTSFQKTALAVVTVLTLAACASNPMTRPTRGTLLVTTEPAQEATITIDGKDTGKLSDHSFPRLMPGPHKIEARSLRDSDGKLLMGAGSAQVIAGKVTRLTIMLSTQSIELAESTGTAVPVAERASQKSILDYYHAISNKDFYTAYALLTEAQKQTIGSFFKFKKAWAATQKMEVVKMLAIKTDASREDYEIIVKTTAVDAAGAASTTEQKLSVVALAVPQGGSTIWKLEGFAPR